MVQELNLDDIVEREAPFSVKGVKYIIREPSAETGAWRRSKLIENTDVETVPDGRGGETLRAKRLATGTGEIELGFISRCIFKVNGDGQATEENETIDIIRKWPDRLVSQLVQWARNSGGGDEDESPFKLPESKPNPGTTS